MAALPTEVTSPVKLALVTTVAALPTEVTPPVKLALVTTVATTPEVVTPPVSAALGVNAVRLTKSLPLDPRDSTVTNPSANDRPVPVVGWNVIAPPVLL